jgi:hypothetical protein
METSTQFNGTGPAVLPFLYRLALGLRSALPHSYA